VLGIVAAAPWLAVLLAGGYVPRLLAGGRHRAVNAAALALSGMAVLTLALVTQPAQVFAANLCLGLALILRWVACDSWIIGLAPPAWRGRVIGFHETLMGCSIAAGPLIAALCGSRTLLPFLVSLALLLCAAGSLLAVQRTGAVDTVDPTPPPRRKSRALISLMTLSALIAGCVETSSISLLPVLSQQAHWPVAGTLALGSFTVGGTVAQLPFGLLADRTGHRFSQVLAALVILGMAAVLLTPLHSLPALLLPALCLLGGAAGGMITLAIIEAGSLGPQQVAGATAQVALAYTLGSITGPPAVGALTASTGPGSFPLAFAALVLIFCTACALTRRRAGIALAAVR
jgi:MFS family permease